MISLISINPIRREAAESAEMISQLLFGEDLEVLEEAGTWTKIKTLHDNYEGWVDTKMLSERQIPIKDYSIVTSLTATLKSDDATFPVVMGSRIPNLSIGRFVLGTKWFELLSGEISARPFGTEAAIQALFQLKNAPYLWGGRSPFGIDCSGLSQLFYRLIGKDIPRDASQQIALGEDVFLSEAQAGDLAFFEKEGRVTHVGVLLDNSTIIHASGHVRIDGIDANGIYIKAKQSYSHTLVGVKRL
jgi:hypothetical protein